MIEKKTANRFLQLLMQKKKKDTQKTITPSQEKTCRRGESIKGGRK